MFGRKRHVAQVTAPPAPGLSAERLFEIIHAKIADAIGENGAWSVTRREADSDTLFHGMLAHSIAAQITNAIGAEQVEGVSAVAAAETPAVKQDKRIAVEAWEPARITMFADLRRPVAAEDENASEAERRERSIAA